MIFIISKHFVDILRMIHKRYVSVHLNVAGGVVMKLLIDGICVVPQPGESLLDIIRRMGLDSDRLSERPLAAQIAGEVFNLNYIPVRERDITEERVSIRRAMAASKGEIRLLRYDDPAGKDVYTRTAQYIMFLALHQLYPQAHAKMNCTVGPALFVEVTGADGFSAAAVKEKISQLVEQDAPFLRRRVTLENAISGYQRSGDDDKARLLSWRKETYFDQYVYEDFSDYYYGELAPSMGYLSVWDVLPAEDGLLFVYPDENAPDSVAPYTPMPNFTHVNRESKRWCTLMECETVADLNDLVINGKIRELIRVNEALHEKRYAQVADEICRRGAKAVMLAGPSSSGKTTSANRLGTQLRVHGKKPILMSLDDYYVDRDTIQPGPDGKVDLEHINTIDTDLFSIHLKALLSGKEVELPSFNFLTGKREWKGHKMQLDQNTVIIVEGLHALNPILLPDDLDPNLVFKFYVSALLPLNLDYHNRIPSSFLRLMRRTVRDLEGRGSSVEQTMSMWDSVRRGEHCWIFPFQENADVIFNTSTIYELAILKRHIYPLLTAVEPEESCYEQVRALVKILNYVQEADVDDEIPPTSLVREFIGGNSYYK